VFCVIVKGGVWREWRGWREKVELWVQEPLDGDLEQYSTWTREELGSEDLFKLAIDIDTGN
jgi:hypothetical protein